MTNFHRIFVILVTTLISLNKGLENDDILQLFRAQSPDYVSVKDIKASIQILINNMSQQLYCFEKEMLHVEFAKCLEIDKILSMTHLDATAKKITRENAADLSEIFLHGILDFQQSCVSTSSDIQCPFTSHRHEEIPEDINGVLAIIDTVWSPPEISHYLCFDSESILKEARSIDNSEMSNKRLIITLLMGYLLQGHCFHVRKTKADFVDDIFHMYGDHCSSFINLEGIKKIMTDLQHSHQEHDHKHGIGHDHFNDVHYNHNHHDHKHEHDCPSQYPKSHSDNYHHHIHHDHSHDHDDHDHTHHIKFHPQDHIKHNLDDDHIDHIHSNKMFENLKKNLQDNKKMDDINKEHSTIKSFEDRSFISYTNDDVSTEMPSIYADLGITNEDHLNMQPLFEDGNEKNISGQIVLENTNSSIVSKDNQNNASIVRFEPSEDDYNPLPHQIHYLLATNIEDANLSEQNITSNYSDIQNNDRYISENISMNKENHTFHILNKRSTLNHHSLSSKSSHPEPTSHMINTHSSIVRQSLSKQNDDVQKVYLFKEKEEIMLPFQNTNLANKCWSAEELVKKFDHSGNSSLTKQDFVELCPAIIQQILSGVCNKKHKLIKMPPTTWELYGYSTLSIFLITLTSLAGVLLMPLIAQQAYHYVMSGFYGLAFSTLAGDAFLHLIPQYLGVHSHGDDEHIHHHDSFLEPYMALQLVVLGSVYCLYLFEVILHFICKEKHQGTKSHGHSHVHISNEMPSFNKTKSLAQLALSQDQSESSFDTELAEAQSNKKPPNLMVSPPMFLGLTSLALVVIIGDTFHNFSDGLAIGSAFASSVSGGLSTSIAVFCHELPHEFGDFIILISTGLSIPKALLINFISGCSSFIGLYIGIVIGDNEMVQKYIMAFIAGIFIYVAMTEMLPELKEHRGGSRILTLLVKSLGILLGVAIMVVISIYENVTFS